MPVFVRLEQKMSGKQLQRKMLGIIAAVSLAFALLPLPLSAQAKSLSPMVVSYDMGGSLQSRQTKIRIMRRQGQRVEIRGRCYSACTMYLGLPDVCVAPDAVLGFHGPQGMLGALPQDAFDHWSRVMARNLRKPLKTWFMTQARHVKQGVLRISGAKLIKMGYARC
jgi:hypothetical protein